MESVSKALLVSIIIFFMVFVADAERLEKEDVDSVKKDDEYKNRYKDGSSYGDGHRRDDDFKKGYKDGSSYRGDDDYKNGRRNDDDNYGRYDDGHRKGREYRDDYGRYGGYAKGPEYGYSYGGYDRYRKGTKYERSSYKGLKAVDMNNRLMQTKMPGDLPNVHKKQTHPQIFP